MTTTLKAIETVYNGYRFRSRLEARWAVFFDTLGIRYEYEKEGYELDGVRYLPDFWLPDLQCWVEVKGQEPTEEEIKKANLLHYATARWVVFFQDVPHVDPSKLPFGRVVWPTFMSNLDERAYWEECMFCGELTLSICSTCKCLEKLWATFPNRNSLLYQLVAPEQRYAIHTYQAEERLLAAFTAARQARFEHGEHGK